MSFVESHKKNQKKLNEDIAFNNSSNNSGKIKFASCLTHTNGSGLWSSAVKQIKIIKIKFMQYKNEDNVAELRAYFTGWNTSKDGLIYTDELWIKEFRKEMIKQKLLLPKHIKEDKYGYADFDYSEQGMQGNNYVSLDVQNTAIEYMKSKLHPSQINIL